MKETKTKSNIKGKKWIQNFLQGRYSTCSSLMIHGIKYLSFPVWPRTHPHIGSTNLTCLNKQMNAEGMKLGGR